MDRRLKLQSQLEQIPTVKEVYFQPPESVKMVYPCIRYYRTRARTDKADDLTYRFVQCYDLIIIDADPDSTIARYIVEHFPMAELNSTYVADNLYHASITLYY